MADAYGEPNGKHPVHDSIDHVGPKYDDMTPEGIAEYGALLEGKTFYQVLRETGEEYDRDYGDRRFKGGLGNLVEECHFGYRANSSSAPDFPKAGVELKVTPFEKTDHGRFKAGERLVLTMISYDVPLEDNFILSHFWKKCRTLLLVYYFRDRKLESNLDYRITFTRLFTPPAKDLEIIRQDYNRIASKVNGGRAQDLSEGETFYLGACTKGATAEKSLVPQRNSQVLAKRRAFCYKIAYMTFVLNEYVISSAERTEYSLPRHAGSEYEPILTDPDAIREVSFADYIQNAINRYVGKTDRELALLFGLPYSKNKSQWIELAYRMLGIRSNRAEEFVKAGIVVKATRIERESVPKESSPLPVQKFLDLVKEEKWEDSELYAYIEQTRFLSVVFKLKPESSEYVLLGCRLWNVPTSDFEEVRKGWEQVRDVFRKGILLTPVHTAKGIVVRNNLPGKDKNRVIHMRPHTSKTFYRFKDGTELGSGTEKDSNELPDGRWMTNQSFWLNNTYIADQVKDLLRGK